jgi:hypothetical protein
LVPYLFWTVFWYLSHLITADTIGAHSTSHIFWFLPVLFACFVIHTALVLICSGCGARVRMISGLFLILLMYLSDSGNYWIGSVRYHYTFFLTGALINRRCHPLTFGCVTATVGAVLWIILLPFWQFSMMPQWLSHLAAPAYLQRAVYVAFRTAVALLPMPSLYLLVAITPEHIKRCLAYVGLYTIHIYLMHIGLLEWTYPHLTRFGGPFWLYPIPFMVIVILASKLVQRNRYCAVVLFGRQVIR